MTEYFNGLYNNLIEWFVTIFQDFGEFMQDLFVWCLDTFLTGISALITAIPVPEFLTNGLSYYLTFIDPSILYFLERSGFAEGLALLGAGVTFRLLRKLITLGQW